MTTVIGIDASLTSLGMARLTHEPPSTAIRMGDRLLEWVGDTWHFASKGTDQDTIADTCNRITWLIGDAYASSAPCDLGGDGGAHPRSRESSRQSR